MVVNATTPCPAEWPGHGVVGADRARSADDVDGSQGLLSPAQEDHSPGFGGEHLGGGQSLVFRGDLDVVDVGASVPDGTAGLALVLAYTGGDEASGHVQAVGELGDAVTSERPSPPSACPWPMPSSPPESWVALTSPRGSSE